MTERYEDLPLVYSCSGCSSAAQMANDLAVELDRKKIAEMSCIAGVGGDVPSLVSIAQSGDESERPIVVIDGCPLECAKNCLERQGISADRHYELLDEGVPKEYHTDYDDERAEGMFEKVVDDLQEVAEA